MQPYNDQEPKKEQVQRMFDRVAPRYDLLNRVLSMGTDRGWRRKLVRTVRLDGRRTLLDVATGTGDLAFAISRKCAPCSVTGFDLSAGMLKVARKRALKEEGGKTAERGQIQFVQGEAEAMPFAAAEFDAVTCAFGVRNFHGLEAGLSEMARVLCDGGKVYILEFSTPRNRLFGAVYKWYFHKVLPFVGGAISRDMDAYKYLPGSVDEFPPPEKFLEMLRGAGFEDCNCRRLTNGVACLYTATLTTRRE